MAVESCIEYVSIVVGLCIKYVPISVGSCIKCVSMVIESKNIVYLTV